MKSFAAFRPALFTAAGLLLTGSAFSQQIATNVTHDPRKPSSDWFLATDAVYTSGPNTGQTLFGGTGNLFCFNRYAHNPAGDGEVNNYTVVDSSLLIEIAGGEAKGEALVNWAFDNFYGDYLATPYDNPTYAFQLVLWEIAHDFDGTVASLDIYTGRNSISNVTPSYEPLINSMVANFDSISSSYRSSTYQITYLESVDTDNQDMLYVTTIPEPGSLALLGLAGVAAFGRRRRTH